MRNLHYDWQRIQALVDALGEDFDSKISAAVVSSDLDTIATAVAIGSGVTADEVKAESPPIGPTVKSVMDALNVAFHGTTEAPAATGEKNPSLLTWLVRRVRKLFRLD